MACGPIVTAWAVSVIWHITLRVEPDWLRMGYGAIGVYYEDSPYRSPDPDIPRISWWAERTSNVTPFLWPRTHMAGCIRVVVLPFWALFVCVAVPTVCAWRHDRRPPCGHCQACGHNLTGNVTGICPECGNSV